MKNNNQKPNMENYSFCLFRIPEEGGRVLWEVTNSCNYTCDYCIFSAEKGKISGELSTDEVFKTLEELKERDFSHIKYTGGEPFIRKDFVDILTKTCELGYEVDVSTNASLITEEKAKQLGELELKMVHVSLDGSDAKTHEAVRGPNTYDRTIRGIQNLVENDVYVRLGAVIHKDNQNEIEEQVKNAAELGVEEIIFSYMEPVGRMGEGDERVSQKPMYELKKELEYLSAKYESQVKVKYSFTEDASVEEKGKCPGGNKFLYIDNLGQVSPCTWVVEKEPKYKSELRLKENSLNEIMADKPMNSYLQNICESNKEGCAGCPARIRNN